MKRKPTFNSLFLMVVALLIGAGVANAQSKKVRPPVAGDGKYYALPNDTVVPQEFYVERPTLNNAGFEWYVSGDDNHNATVTVRFREVGKPSGNKACPCCEFRMKKSGGTSREMFTKLPTCSRAVFSDCSQPRPMNVNSQCSIPMA